MKKRWLSLLLALCMVVTLVPVLSTQASAAITAYQQTDSRWRDVPYGYSDTAGTVQAYLGKGASGNVGSGCGVLAYTNAVYYLTGNFVEPKQIAEYSIKNGHRENGVGTKMSLYSAFAKAYGNQFGFDYDTSVSGYSNLASKLKSGYVAICSKPNHIMAIVDYNESTSKYLLLDSVASSNRGTSGSGYAWKTTSQLDDIGLRSTFYILKSTGKPAAPTITSTSSVSTSSIKINWDSVANATSYRIDRRLKGTETYSTVATNVKGTSYTDTGLDAGTMYWYRVYASNSAGTSSGSVKYNGWTKCDPPTISSAQATGTRSIKLTWSSTTGAKTFNITRRMVDDDTYETIATGITGTTYTDTNLSPNTKYYYHLFSINDVGSWSEHSGAKSATTFGNIANVTITLPATSYVYTGSAIKPVPTAKQNDVTLKSGTDYSVSYSNNINVGTATVTVTGKGDYSGTKSVTFNITAKPIADGSFTLSFTEAEYSGSEIKPKVTVRSSDESNAITLIEGTDYTLSYCNNINPGTAEVVVTGKGNYSGTKELTFTIKLTKQELDITAQPVDYIGTVGDTATFSVTAEGIGQTYQWQYSDNNGKTWTNSKSTTDTATCAITAARDGRLYRCIVKDSGGSSVTSSAAKLIVKPAITTQPKDYTGAVGDTATFTVKATGPNLTYQWQYKDAGGSWTNSGSNTTATATCKITAARDGRQYRCIVTAGNGEKVKSTAAKITVQAATLAITTQPKAASVVDTATASFKVAATGTGLKYQWQYKTPTGDWKNCTSATTGYNTATLKVAGVTGSTNRDGYQYRCVVTDANGNKATSNAAKLTVFAIKTQPANASAASGKTATFKVTATGSDLSYQWQWKKPGGSWTDCTSATTGYNKATLKVEAAARRNGYQYRCIIISGTQTLTSSAVTLTVK